MPDLAVLVPIYKAELDAFEQFSLTHSLKALKGRIMFFMAPENLELDYYEKHYPGIPVITFPDEHFVAVASYSRLLMSRDFYDRFEQYEYLLILQTDALVFRDDLDYWLKQPYDYVGAPWPNGYELFVNIGQFEGDMGKKVRVTVGNGGFNLRRTSACRALIGEFPEAIDYFQVSGSSEDLFFSFMGALSERFLIPNEIVASRFSVEISPAYYYRLHNQLPMGTHAWWGVNRNFWKSNVPEVAAFLASQTQDQD